jgi:hypothetical protein
MATLTSILTGPCIFSCAARAFLNGVGVLGVGIMTVFRYFGVLELREAHSVRKNTKIGIKIGEHDHDLQRETLYKRNQTRYDKNNKNVAHICPH